MIEEFIKYSPNQEVLPPKENNKGHGSRSQRPGRPRKII